MGAYMRMRQRDGTSFTAKLHCLGPVAANTLEVLPPGDVSFSISTAFGGAGQLIEVEILGGPEETLG